MVLSVLRSLSQLGRRWKPLNFSNPNFIRLSEDHKIEEETLPYDTASYFYPTRIGEVIKERYQVVGKLGYGSTSTAWLARDMEWDLSWLFKMAHRKCLCTMITVTVVMLCSRYFFRRPTWAGMWTTSSICIDIWSNRNHPVLVTTPYESYWIHLTSTGLKISIDVLCIPHYGRMS